MLVNGIEGAKKEKEPELLLITAARAVLTGT